MYIYVTYFLNYQEEKIIYLCTKYNDINITSCFCWNIRRIV
jgi:hypothetical protein